MPGYAWTAAEDEMVRTRYQTEDTTVLAARLGRTTNAVQIRAKTLGLSKRKEVAVGDKFHFLEVTAAPYMKTSPGSKKPFKVVLVRCTCGTEKEVALGGLKKGVVKSCGCYNRKAASERMLKMNDKEDIPIGFVSGSLTVVGKPFVMDYSEGRLRCVVCECQCGEFTVAPESYLYRQRAKSCGCLWGKAIGDYSRTHGMSRTRLFRIWSGMIDRCTNEETDSWENYGGRGIKVCQEWLTPENFRDWALANGYDDALSIDRVDNNGDYTPENCRWVDPVTQANNRRDNRLETCWGETKTVANWARDARCVVTRSTLKTRINALGWPLDKAMTTPNLRQGSQILERKPSLTEEATGNVGTDTQTTVPVMGL